PAPSALTLQPASSEWLIGDCAIAFQAHQRHAIADFSRAVPGTMLGDEDLVPVCGRELRAGVEAHSERGDVRSQVLCRRSDRVAGVLATEFRVGDGAGMAIRIAEIQSWFRRMIQ